MSWSVDKNKFQHSAAPRRSIGRPLCTVAIGVQILLGAGCGSQPDPITSLSISPARVSVSTGATLQFFASVKPTGNTNAAVTWSIDRTAADDESVGTISTGGLYTAPAVVPYPSTAVIRATGISNPGVVALAIVNITSPGEDWPKFRRDLANSGVSGETGISSSNINLMSLKWKFNAGAPVSASPAVATVRSIRTVYVGHANGTMYALNAETGEQLWSYTVDQIGPCSVYLSLGCLLASSAAVENGIVYFGSGNGFVYALDAATGALQWKTQIGDPNLGYAVYASPAVYKGRVYVGVASAYDTPCVPGRLDALDATTGAPIWKFDTVDQATCPTGTCVGAAVWSSPAVDAQFGTVYVGTGNPGASCIPPTANAAKYPDGILGLDPGTGQLKSYFQAIADDRADADMGAAPILFQTSTIDQCAARNQVRYWLGVTGKNGKAYLGPRGLGGLLRDPAQIASDPSIIIASPLALPYSQSQACGSEGLQVTDFGNHIFVPTGGGQLIDVQQPSIGQTTSLGIIQPPPCPQGDFCLQWSSPAAIQDLIFIGGGDNSLHAVTANGTPNGKFVWQFPVQGPVFSSPAISHGRIYFGSNDGFIYCLSINGQ